MCFWTDAAYDFYWMNPEKQPPIKTDGLNELKSLRPADIESWISFAGQSRSILFFAFYDIFIALKHCWRQQRFCVIPADGWTTAWSISMSNTRAPDDDKQKIMILRRSHLLITATDSKQAAHSINPLKKLFKNGFPAQLPALNERKKKTRLRNINQAIIAYAGLSISTLVSLIDIILSNLFQFDPILSFYKY